MFCIPIHVVGALVKCTNDDDETLEFIINQSLIIKIQSSNLKLFYQLIGAFENHFENDEVFFMTN
mgnify:FL=1